MEFADQLLAVMPSKPRFDHHRNYAPAYIPSRDTVTLPPLGQFTRAESYYAALFHELARSTGHPNRLNRFSRTQGSRFESYAFEELVVEFAAAFLCAFTGLSNPMREKLRASYLKGWSEALRKDPSLVFRAASAAQSAADYIRGKAIVEPANDPAADAQLWEVEHE